MYRISWWKHKSFWPSKINKSFNRFAKDDKAEEPVLENANELIAALTFLWSVLLMDKEFRELQTIWKKLREYTRFLASIRYQYFP